MIFAVMQKGEKMDDLISRQAAIDEIEKWRNALIENCHYVSASDAKLIRDGIKHLPSVQPEIIRCRECKYWKHDHTCREHSLVTPMGAEEFCSRAERRETMTYPQVDGITPTVIVDEVDGYDHNDGNGD